MPHRCTTQQPFKHVDEGLRSDSTCCAIPDHRDYRHSIILGSIGGRTAKVCNLDGTQKEQMASSNKARTKSIKASRTLTRR